MKLTRIFLIILVFILVLNPGLLVAANEEGITTIEAEHVHLHYFDNAMIPPFLGKDTVNRILIYGDYLPLYLSNPAQFVPYPTSKPPYKNLWNSAQEVINAANNSNDPLHAQALNLRGFAEAMLAMEEKENLVKSYLTPQTISSALNQLGIFSYDFKDIIPSSIWQYKPAESMQTPYHPNSLMQLDNTFIAPMNQWNSITYNPAEDYIEAFDELLHPVPDMSFLKDAFGMHGPMWELGTALADIATPYTFLPALFMMGFDLYLQSKKEIGFLYPTTTGHEISPCPQSGMVMIKRNKQQMIYKITGGEGGSFANIPSGDFGIFFVDAVNAFGGGLRPTISLTNADLVSGGQVKYTDVSAEYQSRDYALNLESHVGVAQNGKWLYDTVVGKIQGSGRLILLPFKIGSWFEGKGGQEGDILSKTTIGIRFKDQEEIHTFPLADCLLENISGNQDDILMWSGTVIFDAEEYGEQEIEEIYLTVQSGAIKTSGTDKFYCHTSLSFSPYFLKPIISLPQDIETFPGEEVTFQTALLEKLTNASVNVSWEIPSGTESLEGYEVTHTFTESGIYDCKLMIDPEYQARPPALEVTDPQEKFWNTDAGKMVWSFQVKVLPPVDLEVSWAMSPCFPLNSKNYPGHLFYPYPGRKSSFNLYLTNKGNKDFLIAENDSSSPPLTLSFYIDRDDNQIFSPQELVWSTQITGVKAQSSVFFNLEKIFSMDKLEGDLSDDQPIYKAGFHRCKLQVNTLSQELNQENNFIIEDKEFVISPEMATPDFAVENATYTIDQYKNIAINFDLAEKCVDTNIVDKWNSYHKDDPFVPQWGPISYELWLRDGYLLYSGEVTELLYHETKFLQLDSINLSYIPAGRYEVYLGINPTMLSRKLLPESKYNNNDGYMGWLTLTDDTTSPWYTKGGDRGHTNWKNLELKPPLITDWEIDTAGIPVDMVCNSKYFYVLTSSGSIEKYNTSGELQYTISGFDGTPLLSSVMLLIYPDTTNEKLLAFSDDYRLVLINTQTGGKIWTSSHIFTETTYGSKPNLKEYSRTLNFDGRYLVAGWPLVLYSFNSNLNLPSLLWEKEEFDAYHDGDTFILGNNILAGQYLYSLNGEELNRFEWIGDEAILRLSNIYTDQYNYNYLSEQLTELENLRDPGSFFSNNLLGGNKMQCLDNQGNELWVLPTKIEQEYYSPDSTSQSIPVYIRSNSVINLWNGSEGYAYGINNNRQLLAVDLETGTPVWYREFVCPPELITDLREKIPPFMLHQVNSGALLGQSDLTRGEGFSVNIQKIIPFQNSLLIGTIDSKIYRLSTAHLDHLEVQGYIPSIFYGPSSRLKVKIQAFNEQGVEILLEDKITVTGDYIDQNHLRYYYNQEEISLPIGLPDSKMYLVDYPNLPYIVSNHFNFVDIQTLSPRVSVPLVIENIQSRPIIRKYKTQAGKETELSMNDEAQLKYKPKNSNNDVRFYYSDYGKEDLSQVVHEHSYHIIVGISNAGDIIKDYDFIDLQINLPEGIDTDNLTVKINNELYSSWSLSGNLLIIHCLNAFSEQNTNNLTIIILKSAE
jgi:hypothetical protein